MIFKYILIKFYFRIFQFMLLFKFIATEYCVKIQTQSRFYMKIYLVIFFSTKVDIIIKA